MLLEEDLRLVRGHKKSRRLIVGSFPMYCRRFSVYCGFLRKSGCQAYPRQAEMGCGAACLAPRASAPVSEQADDDAVLNLGLKVSAALLHLDPVR